MNGCMHVIKLVEAESTKTIKIEVVNLDVNIQKIQF